MLAQPHCGPSPQCCALSRCCYSSDCCSGLLADRGRIELNLPAADVVRFEAITGLKVTGKVTEQVDAAEEAAQETTVDAPAVETAEPTHVYYDEHGILPAVWRTRDFWWGGADFKTLPRSNLAADEYPGPDLDFSRWRASARLPNVLPRTTPLPLLSIRD